ncbi:MAG: hypothetical protein IPM64_11490 [Phycisphaerales bacterium]|nr:hypothetical protein [Phycisphaerales bacterium]
MKTRLMTAWTRLVAAGGSLLFLGSCGLSDQQIQQVWQSVITSALTSSVNVFVGALGQSAGGG